MTGQLIDAVTGSHVWAERYDCPVRIFLPCKMRSRRAWWRRSNPSFMWLKSAFRTKSPDSLDAWGCVVRAMPSMWSWVAEDNRNGETLLLGRWSLIQITPAQTRCSAWTYGVRAHLGSAEPNAALALALKTAQRALDFDIDDPWAHLAIGYVHMVARRFKPSVEALMKRLTAIRVLRWPIR